MTAAHYTQHWDDKFRVQEWGRYPPEDLVRFIGRNYSGVDRRALKVLEVGCGPGANVWFLHREGFSVSGIDGSPTGIERAKARMLRENAAMNPTVPDMVTGNFEQLPWEGNSFDAVFDIFAIYANPVSVIEKTLSEVARVLKPGGTFYSKCWGTRSTGYGMGTEVGPDTFDNLPAGPCQDMGITHFYTIDSMRDIYSKYFDVRFIDTVMRIDHARNYEAEEFSGHFIKKAQ